MYDELVKRLREAYELSACGDCGYKGDKKGPLFKEAADAIEELEFACNRYEKDYKDLCAYLPKWIPVTERLPDSGVYVLACCRIKWVGGGGRSYVCHAFYTEPKAEPCSYSDDIDAEYDEETDEYYMPEGWWEVIKNWDDYSCVAIADFVTHWMPLPEPPKEDAE